MSRSRGARWTTDLPPMRISPAVTSSRPAIIRNVVVFPHPLGPTRMTNSWSRTVRSTPATARVSPNRFSTRSGRTSAMEPLHAPQLLLGLFHGLARVLPLADLRQHGRDDELRVHAGGRLGHRARIADEVHVLLEVLEELQLGLVADHRHRLLQEGAEEGVVVSGRGLESLEEVGAVHRVEELLGEVVHLGEAVD